MEEELIAGQKEIILALVFGIIFILLLTIGLFLFFYFSRKKIVEKDREKYNMMLSHQQKILQNTIRVQEEERLRISQDLHDAISAKLNVVSLTTHMLIDDSNTIPEQKESLNHILEITTNTIESSRKIAHDLMPPVLDKFGLKVALEELFDEFTKSKKVKIESNIDQINYLSKDQELHVFRIAQELINNSIRHGKATLLNFSLEKNTHGFVLNYSDNGVGFNPNEVKKKPGIGMQNINSRVEILEGDLTVKSTINKGSSFTITSKNEH
ncbi:MAG: two-component sensor histidine kinase [Bacteroidetes bacterium MedPE-SWsnd-G2]|nr:MAG: two-component sensor histidine kinase [Bacteroidetes bacterium MedPE-SWsnd-G2]